MKNYIKINLKTLICDLTFIIIGFICLYFYQKYSSTYVGPMVMSVATAAAIILIYIFPIKTKEENHIYENKIAMIPYCIIYALLLILIFVLNYFFGLNNSTASNNKGYFILIILGLSLTIFICYFFKIKLKDFNWNMSVKSFILVVAVYIVFKLVLSIKGISDGTIHVSNIFNIGFIIKFVTSSIGNSVYPGFFEEVLYRGFLISGLKGFGLSDNKCNIIQAILFGISHVMSWGTASWVFLLCTAAQAMLGYVLGKIYFKTGSLLPCILFHGLLDAI